MNLEARSDQTVIWAGKTSFGSEMLKIVTAVVRNLAFVWKYNFLVLSSRTAVAIMNTASGSKS